MIRFKVNDDIEINSDVQVIDEKELLKELSRIICFTIAIYKRRIEKLQEKELSTDDEIVINHKIKDSIVMIPLSEIRNLIKEKEI